MASALKGLFSSFPKACKPPATFGLCQNASMRPACFWALKKLSDFKMMTTQDAKDMTSSKIATKRVTASPSVHKLMSPNSLFMSALYSKVN